MANMAEIGSWAYDAGIRGPNMLAQAIAIATAESGGNPNAVGDRSLTDEEWGPSIGLWQIRSRKAEKGRGTTRDEDRLKDPAFNARSMATISSKGLNWSPWSVTSPRDITGYARYLAAMVLASGTAAGVIASRGADAAVDKATEPVTGALDQIGDLAGVLSDSVQRPLKIMGWLMEEGTWERIAYGVIGGLALLTGLALFVGSGLISSVTGEIKKAKKEG